MNNKLLDLNNYLFESIENIDNATNNEELNKEIDKANAKVKIADAIIRNADVMLKGVELQMEYGLKNIEGILCVEDLQKNKKTG